MIEIPEAIVISKQLNETISGKKISKVTAAHSPHKFAWYYGDPKEYHDLLVGRRIGKAQAYGGLVEIEAEGAVILFGDGVNIKYHRENETIAKKHQLFIEFENNTAITGSVQMYGGMWCFKDGEFKNTYFLQAKGKASPLSEGFDIDYYLNIINAPEVEKLSAKALLATEQRIPGLGNGVLQDILFNAGIHPRKKVKTFTEEDKNKLYNSIKSTLAEMVLQGGRDTEKDIFGSSGGYKTKLSKNTVNKPCPLCGEMIKKEAYLGGSIYYCSGCQGQ